MRCDTLAIDLGDHDTVVGDLCGIPPIPPDDSEDRCSDLAGMAQRMDDIRTDTPLEIATTDREDENTIPRPKTATTEIFDEGRIPALIIRPCSQLGDIVDRRVRLEGSELTKVVDRMRGMRSATTNAEEEETATPVTVYR